MDVDHLHNGLVLFNAGHYWHAHECWELAWHAADEPDATCYKGIIQAAAAMVHWQRGNSRGLRQNWMKARPKLVALPGDHLELDLRSFIPAMDAFVRTAGTGPALTPPALRLLTTGQ